MGTSQFFEFLYLGVEKGRIQVSMKICFKIRLLFDLVNADKILILLGIEEGF